MASRALLAESVDELLEQAVDATARPARATIAIAVLRMVLWRMFFMIFLCSGNPYGCVVFKRRVKGEPRTFLRNSREKFEEISPKVHEVDLREVHKLQSGLS